MKITVIKNIAGKREEDFQKLRISDTSELIRHFPRRYLDLTKKTLLSDAYHNDIVLTTGRILALPPTYVTTKRVRFVKATCVQNGEPFTAIWFNQPYVLSKLKVGEEYLFYGRVQNKFGAVSIVNPTFEPIEKNYRLKGIVPQYLSKGNLSQKIIRDSVSIALRLEKPTSIIPSVLQKKYDLMDLEKAYQNVHLPSSFEQKDLASDRIAVEEYFALISAFKLIKGSREQVRVNKYTTTQKEIETFIKGFPFEFTNGQKSAVKEIVSDLTGNFTMNRLLQGDVGSGKTAVALVSIFVAVNSGYQAVMLAPTEVLAKQNYNILNSRFDGVELLTGSMTAKEKRLAKERLVSGESKIAVGTHAILQSDVEFKNLALCVCDEQHRFGVSQRSVLSEKGTFPDLLVMSATPIPRTLSLIFYGDLDISTISDKPINRQKVQTNIVPKYKYRDMLEFIKNEVQKGNQAYFVCPKIEEDEEGTVMSVTELFEELKESLPSINFGLLHGKMKEKEKSAVYADFKEKKIDCLVSTTVIEVGVDVPDATVMVIYNAERFGLSQLHQLRGRVGRSDKKSYCFLLTGIESETSSERLKILAQNSDGFKIAEFDYKMRGSGDFLGVRQSGKFISDLGFLSYTASSVFLAKKIVDDAFTIGQNLPEIQKVALAKYERLKDITLN